MQPKSVQRALDQYRHRGFDCLCGNLRLATRVVTAAYDEKLAAAGISSAQLSVLWCVMSAERLSMQRIGELLAMEKSTVTRNVASMRAKGLLRVEAAADARVKEVCVTPAGQRAFAAAIGHWQAAQRDMASLIGSERFHTLVSQTRNLATRSRKPRS
ncbi:MAG: MarR family winged helix-turn-helix transcriptional regulator [Usitatibacter sp.]